MRDEGDFATGDQLASRLAALGIDFKAAVTAPAALRTFSPPVATPAWRERRTLLAGAVAVACAVGLVGGSLVLGGAGRSARTPRVAIAASPSTEVPVVVGPTGSPSASPANTPPATSTPATQQGAGPTPGVPDCTTSDMAVTLATDRGDYAAGARVNIVSTERNKSTHACQQQLGLGCRNWVMVDDAAGDNVDPGYRSEPAVTCAYGYETIPPGGARQRSDGWDQVRGCPPPPAGTTPAPCASAVGAGRYDASLVFAFSDGALTASASFTIEAAPYCNAGQVSVTSSTDKASYAAGQTVTLTSVLRNTSQTFCRVKQGATEPSFSIDNQSGEVWRTCARGCSGTLAEMTLAGGDQVTQSATWDGTQCTPTACTGASAPPGNYTVTSTWAGHASAPVQFSLT